jgi:DNA-binding helix-turn-helix protein|uniref:Cro/C1-type HTH DNA-binding domain protein n=1 Tax=Siphoviridae sp. cttU829 TaxID=2823605 RepID=A0A8S5LC96_9CAUD|nr:MAG TPA: Cro/C1-type HTH DNA-binding domain protein [Siphoviridae sp. cttU829]
MKRLDVVRAAHERGMNIAGLAQKLGISRFALSSRINANPTLNSLYEIAEALKCDITDLFREPRSR